MNKIFNKKLWSYVGRFSLVYLIIYALIALAFLIFQDILPVSDKTALEFFKPYKYPDLIVLIRQGIRGLVLALILYPFYKTFVRGDRGVLILFGVMWGLGLFSSVEPIPGSIEGLIYTKTSIAEHIVVAAANTIQMFLFSSLFLFWERKHDIKNIKRSVNNE